MKRKIAYALSASLVSAFMVSAPAFATHLSTDIGGPPDPVAHDFCDSGEEFAHGHVVGLAQDQLITPPEAGGVHNPGLAHEGFAVCDPTESDPFE
jgi:hypothetical protein